jgi:hypothetical protein
MFGRRAGLVADWHRVFAEAARLGKAVELDATPRRQDLPVDLARIAVAEGCVVLDGERRARGRRARNLPFAMATAILAAVPRDRILAYRSVDEVSPGPPSTGSDDEGGPRRSASILLWRTRADGELEVLIGHPGGPFFAKRDDDVWSILKGEYDADEDPLTVARRVRRGERARAPDGSAGAAGRGPAEGGKLVVAWALEGDSRPGRCDVEHVPDGVAAALGSHDRRAGDRPGRVVRPRHGQDEAQGRTQHPFLDRLVEARADRTLVRPRGAREGSAAPAASSVADHLGLFGRQVVLGHRRGGGAVGSVEVQVTR